MTTERQFELQIVPPIGDIQVAELYMKDGLVTIGQDQNDKFVVTTGDVKEASATIDLRSYPFRLRALTSRVEQAGKPLRPYQEIILSAWDVFMVDGYSLILKPETLDDPSINKSQTSIGYSGSPKRRDISIEVIEDVKQKVPLGGAAVWQVKLINTGQRVAAFDISVRAQRADDQWLDANHVEVKPQHILLSEGQEVIAVIKVAIPTAVLGQAPICHDGEHPLAVAVSSPDYPGEEGVATIKFDVNPYYEFELTERLEWIRRSAFYSQHATMKLPLRNLSNTTVQFRLEGWDTDNACAFGFKPPINKDPSIARNSVDSGIQEGNRLVELKPNAVIEAPIEIRPKQYPIVGRPRVYELHFAAERVNGVRKPYPIAYLTAHPLFSYRVLIPLAIFAVLLVTFFTLVILSPRIRTLALHRTNSAEDARVGDQARLAWNLSPFAGTVAISGTALTQTLPVVEPVGWSNTQQAPELSTPLREGERYTLTVQNWIHNIPLIGGRKIPLTDRQWGRDREAVGVGEDVTANELIHKGFTVNPSQIVSGTAQPITITWPAVANATDYFLLQQRAGISATPPITITQHVKGAEGTYRLDPITNAITLSLQVVSVAWPTPKSFPTRMVEVVMPIPTPRSIPMLAIRSEPTSESAGAVIFTVSLSTSSAETVIADYFTANGTALAGEDYFRTSGKLTIPAGQTEVQISVSLRDDQVNESDETFTFNLSNASGATIATSQAVGTILNDDGVPALTIKDAETTENAGFIEFPVTLSNRSTSDVTVNFSVADSSATSVQDYIANNGSITIRAGSLDATIRVNLVDNEIAEGSERFMVSLRDATNATIADSQAIGTILDNDGVPTISISHSEANENAGTMVFTVRLSGVTAQDVTVDYTTKEDAAKPGSDYTTKSGVLTIPAGRTSATIEVTIIDDQVGNEDREKFKVELSNPRNATLGDREATGTIIDNEQQQQATGNITIEKNATGGNGSFGFDTSGDTSPEFTINTTNGAGSNNTILANKAPGDYTIKELVPSDWNLANIACTSSGGSTFLYGSDNNFDSSDNSVKVTLKANDAVACTFTNTKQLIVPGTIIVDKVTVPPGEGQAFSFNLTGPNNVNQPFQLSDSGTPYNSGALTPGTYKVAETQLSGWTLASGCDNGNSPDSIILAAGATVTCTFTNTKTSLPPQTINLRIASGSDDADENVQGGSVELKSQDLVFVLDTAPSPPILQIVGLRFTNVSIPPGTIIAQAYIKFMPKQDASGNASLQFKGEAFGADPNDYAQPFGSADQNISHRSTTKANVDWPSVPNWSKDTPVQTPDLTPIIQEIVTSANWQSGKSIVIIVSGSGTRVAIPADNNVAKAPLLVIKTQ